MHLAADGVFLPPYPALNSVLNTAIQYSTIRESVQPASLGLPGVSPAYVDLGVVYEAVGKLLSLALRPPHLGGGGSRVSREKGGSSSSSVSRVGEGGGGIIGE